MASAIVSSDELWKECARWLTVCGVLREDHKANWPNASIIDLAYILRDGVLLCNLLDVLEPGCIDNKNVNLKPQMAQFLCLRNISVFLNACKNIFTLKETDLFEPLMLFDFSNFHRVLCTLSKLSNCSKVLKKNILGFSIQKAGSKEDIYQSLRSVDVLPVDRNQFADDAEYGSYYSHIKNEEIYQDLCSVQQPVTGPPVEKRDHVIKELLDTEKNYVEVLRSLKVNFMKPLSFLLRPETQTVIFKDIPELYEIHSDFYKQLQSFYTEHKPKLSNTFLNFREKFLIYGSYCANLTDAQALLQEECDQNEMISKEVDRCQHEANNGKFKLRDVLSVPMQRILKYHLLLEKLIEETQRGHEEYVALKRAREAMLDVATYINEVKRDSDHLLLLRQVQDNISDWSIPSDNQIQHYGRLLKDGELKIKSHDDQKIHMRYVFIFDKIIVLCKPMRGNQFSFKESLQLSEFYMEDVLTRPILNREARWSYQWVLVRKNKSSVYTLYARTIDLKKKMMKAIQEALENLEPYGLKNTSHKFEMHTFDKPASCNRCSKFLKGLIYQGYLCRVCGVAVHKDCISQSGKCSLPPPMLHSSHHIDEILKEHLWYAGKMEREEANLMLENRIVGTYLLRVRPNAGETRYALSLKTNDSVRHMRVFRKRVDEMEQYYLSELRYFKSILDLVKFYEHTSLREIYERLQENARLQWPYRQLIGEAVCDYNADGSNHLALREGCQVIVLSQHETEGWWKGKSQNTIGFFPKNCVRVVREVTQDIE